MYEWGENIVMKNHLNLSYWKLYSYFCGQIE